VFLDRSEPAACWRLLRWDSQVDAAVLVGFPFAPLAYAAGRLTRRGIPYVVDIGDPWALTRGGHTVGPFKYWRASRAERRLWRGACGAIVTTSGQATALAALFPHLRILIRPNGYEIPIAVPKSGEQIRPSSLEPRLCAKAEELRMVHYGSLYAPRLDLTAFAAKLVDSGRWRRIVLRQHGDDWNHTLDRVARHIDVEWRPAMPWSDVLREAPQFDAALVIGNHNPVQLPSKVVQYLTLPIPRIALVNGDSTDALLSYVADKPAWATVRADAPDPAASVAELVNRHWEANDLEAPASESWPVVEGVLCDFVLATTGFMPDRTAHAALVPQKKVDIGVGSHDL
jgi:hypothetical protein